MTKLPTETLLRMWEAAEDIPPEGSAEEAMQAAWDASPAGELIDLLHWSLTAADRLAQVTPKGLLRTGIEAKANEIRAVLSNLGAPHV